MQSSPKDGIGQDKFGRGQHECWRSGYKCSRVGKGGALLGLDQGTYEECIEGLRLFRRITIG